MGRPPASPIKLDCSEALIVIHCTDHPWWRACAFHKEDAWDTACAHEKLEHPDDFRHRNARFQRQKRAARHAVRS